MRVSDVYDSTAIDQLCALEFQEQLADLGFNFKKLIKKIGTPFMRVTRAQFKPVRRFFTKKFFLKAAPFLSIAAELLNLVVPGLGVAVGIAISLTATALALKEKKAMAKKAKAAESAAEAQDQAAIKKADADAGAALDKAYATGQTFFANTYGETPELWTKLTNDGKIRFLNVAMYDRNSANMGAMGISRNAFQKMSIAQQQDALSKASQYVPNAKGQTYVPNVPTAAETPTAQAPSVTEATAASPAPVVPPIPPQIAAMLPSPPSATAPISVAPASIMDNTSMMTMVGGGLAVALLAYAIYKRKSKTASPSV